MSVDEWRTRLPGSSKEAPFHGPLMSLAQMPRGESTAGDDVEEAKKANPMFTLFISMAIPLAIEEMRWWDPERRRELGRSLAEVIGSQGDTVETARKEKGATTKAFAAIARGVAALAYQPGGVTFLGTHYEGSE